MAADPRHYTLDVSEHLFRLTTEGLRLHSNATLRYQTLENLIDARAGAVSKIGNHDISTLREHLSVIPTKGNIRINLSMSLDRANSLDAVATTIGQQLNADLTAGDALSVLLFDYVVEQKAAHIMEIGGFDKIERPSRSGSSNGSRP